MRSMSLSKLAMVAVIAGLTMEPSLGHHAPTRKPKPPRDPVRDADRIEAAKGKREKKAAKRARIAARNASPPNARHKLRGEATSA